MMSPSLTIDIIPDEVLLEIFDSYRQLFTQSLWNNEYKWFKLMHVCRRWYHIILTSSTRLDLCLLMTTNNSGNMNTILSPHLSSLPIAIDYHDHLEANLHPNLHLAALEHCNRVRGITFSGENDCFDKLLEKTMRPFPILEILELFNVDSIITELKLPATFLEGSAPHLRRLKLHRISLTSISSLLSSATMLIELSLRIYIPVPTTLLFAHLRSMPCLCCLGDHPFLSVLVAGFTAPFLQDFHILLGDDMRPPFFTSVSR